MCLSLCVSQFCCTLNSKGISRVWVVTYWIQSLQEWLEPMGDELSLLCAAALRGAFWKQVTDDFQISCQPRFPPKSVLFVAARALKALCTSHPFFALMKLILGWPQASSCWVCFVWQERDEKKKNSLCGRDKRTQLCKRFPPARHRWEGIFMPCDERGILKSNLLRWLCGEGKLCRDGVFFLFLCPVFEEGVFGLWKIPTSPEGHRLAFMGGLGQGRAELDIGWFHHKMAPLLLNLCFWL